MATPIPAFVSQVVTSSVDTVQVTSGTSQALATTRYYYFVSNHTPATNGQSLLKAIKDALDTSLGGTTWTVALSTAYKVQLSHNNGSSRTVTFGSTLATALGFTSASFAVANATTVTATNLSYWWWSPNMPISMTGPVMFDPAVSYGCATSAGSAQRSSDMTAAYVANGTQYEAVYTFTGVDGYYRIKPQSGFTNQDFETWWLNGPRIGRRMLMWRDRANATGSNAPSIEFISPAAYIEYNPQPDLRAAPTVVPLSEANLVLWTVRLPLWLTENGATPLSD